jgi:hypothetical protein
VGVLLIPGNSEILEGAAVKELVRLEGEADGSVTIPFLAHRHGLDTSGPVHARRVTVTSA